MRITKKKGMLLFTIVFSCAVMFGATVPPSTAHAESSSAFKDVSSKHWAKSAIDWAINKNMVNGYPNGTFKPENKVTEAEFLTMLLRLYDSKIDGTAKTHWADAYYDYASKYHYTLPGHSDVKLRENIINRTQVAELVSATEGVNLKGDDAIKYLLVFHLAKGKDKDVSIASYRGADSLTRAEAVQFVRNISEFGLGTLVEKQAEPTSPSEIPEINYELTK
ncbi:S-layer homology domain-containing protein [Paenibacillus polymyxa]|uniref:S-layer homology domain-containing protein n=1 Tax=Paenibacillus polymyxa TaxID=1406 RepID=UPI0001E6D6B4|nr:S-layer homology domain-containing protein [Paenibacillus polymyxa]WPQ59876.1 S-layer homology domain-containing protein [Paenibacillus polymyxa]